MAADGRVGHGWAHFFGDGVQPASPTPHLVVSERPHATLRRYLANTESVGDPILLVPPLAVSIDCFDLRPQQSLAAHLLETGRPVYVIDYGTITFADRAMGFEDWIDGILPTALREVSAKHARASRRRGHLEPRRHADPAVRRVARRPAAALHRD